MPNSGSHEGCDHNSEIREGVRYIGGGEAFCVAAKQAPEPGDEHEDEKNKRHPWPRREGGQHEDVISGGNGVCESGLLPEGMPVGLFDPRMDDGEVGQQDSKR